MRGAFRKHRVEPARDIKVSVSVGVAIPRSVTLHVVHQDVIPLVPGYREYRYRLYDGRIHIVDPDRCVIADVIVDVRRERLRP